MTDILGLFGLFMLFLGGGAGGAASAPAAHPEQAPRRARRRRPALPAAPAAPAAWPQTIPEGLPSFPGAAWEYDEPPPVAVQQRAQQLVAPLWRQGKGSHRTEQTAGRWITYRAEIVASGRQGVVAYRVRAGQLPAAPSSPSSPSSRPPSSASWTLPQILTSPAPGWPEAMGGGGAVEVVEGRWYQWSARVDFSTPPSNPRQVAEGIARGLSSAGAVNIAVSDSPPFLVSYQLLAKHTASVPLGVALRLDIDGVAASIILLEGRQIDAPRGPKTPKPAPNPGQVSYPSSPTMRDLKVGDRGEDVRLVQTRLGVTADGIFGKNTQTAVIEFQRARGLAPSLPTEQLRARGFGAVKAATWAALFGQQRA